VLNRRPERGPKKKRAQAVKQVASKLRKAKRAKKVTAVNRGYSSYAEEKAIRPPAASLVADPMPTIPQPVSQAGAGSNTTLLIGGAVLVGFLVLGSNKKK
jgi:hypothetical protein